MHQPIYPFQPIYGLSGMGVAEDLGVDFMRCRHAQEDRSAAIRAMLAKQMPLGAVDEELGAEDAAEVRAHVLA